MPQLRVGEQCGDSSSSGVQQPAPMDRSPERSPSTSNSPLRMSSSLQEEEVWNSWEMPLMDDDDDDD